jgi:hypothetical protein
MLLNHKECDLINEIIESVEARAVWVSINRFLFEIKWPWPSAYHRLLKIMFISGYLLAFQGKIMDQIMQYNHASKSADCLVWSFPFAAKTPQI